MGLFDKIKHAIFGDNGPLGGSITGKPKAAAPATPAAAPGRPPQAAPATPRPAAPAAVPVSQPVDVEAVLAGLAAKTGGGGNWRTSIVDLLKLLDLDSDLAARKELAAELGVNAGAHGSAEQNIALQKAVMRALEKNGGKVPAALKD